MSAPRRRRGALLAAAAAALALALALALAGGAPTCFRTFLGDRGSTAAPPRRGRAACAVACRAAAATATQREVATANRVVQRLFLQARQSDFAPNCWYESPEVTTTSQKRVWEHWDLVRPTRRIDRIDDGATSCGCTWTQLDGRRGVSFLRLDQDGKVSYIREVVEPASWAKFKENNLASLRPVFGVMDGIKNVFNVFDQYLVVEEKDRPAPKPRLGLEAPKSRKAKDVVQYLWEEAQYAEEDPVDRIVAEYSDDAVYEDMTYVDEVWAKGAEALRKYQEDTRNNAPPNLRFVLDELSDGKKACGAIWHVEYNGQKSPRGVSFYSLDDAGKVDYVRASYSIGF